MTHISSGITLGRDTRGRSTRPVPYLRVANVKDGKLDLAEIKEVEATESEIADCKLAPGDILLTEGGDRDKLGRGTFWSGQIPECIHQNHIFRIRSDPSVFNPEFLAYQFGSAYGKAYFLRHAKQTTGIASINKTVLSNFPLLAPSLPTQKEVAARLSKQMAEAARAGTAITGQSELLDSFIHAVLRESLSSAKTVLTRIPDCLREVTEGIGESWTEYPVLGATRAGLAPAKEGVGKNPGRYKPVRPGTIFYNPMRILLGSIAMLDDGNTPGITSPDYVVMTAVEGKLHPVWFYRWFRSPAGAEFIQSLTRGAVRERLLFNRLAPASIPLPTWERQLAAVARLREAERMKQSLRAQLAEVERLPAALLRAAFSRH